MFLTYLPINIKLARESFPKYQTNNPDKERKLPKGSFCSFLIVLEINPIIPSIPAKKNANHIERKSPLKPSQEPKNAANLASPFPITGFL